MSTRDSMTFDIIGVGCGVATLSTVLRLLKRVKREPDGSMQPPSILIIERELPSSDGHGVDQGSLGASDDACRGVSYHFVIRPDPPFGGFVRKGRG
jgi:hypothetical protein